MISVLIPAYNSGRYIHDTLRSVLEQTFQDFEVIVVDDGSTDGTYEVLLDYARRDPRIRVVRNDHGGISRALNRGLEVATRPWIARLDHDDMALPERFARQLAAAARNPEVILWGTYSRHMNHLDELVGYGEAGPTTEREFQRQRRTGEVITVIQPSCLYRRDIALRIGGYDPNFDGAEDIDFVSRMAPHGSIRVLPEYLTITRIHAKSMTANHSSRQTLYYHFIRARNRARLAGGDLTFDAYLDQLDRRIDLRLRTMIHTHWWLNYKNAQVHLVEHRWLRAARCLTLAMLLEPRTTVTRLGSKLQRTLHRTLVIPH